MFELPEFVTLARQLNEVVQGRVVAQGSLGNVTHKFVWYNRTPGEFAALTRGRTVGRSSSRGKWLFVPLDPGYVLLLGECGGRVLYHPPGATTPEKYHLCLSFEDGSSLTVTTQMWGAMELYEQGAEARRRYVRDMRPTPVDPEFTLDYFSGLIDAQAVVGKVSAKALLTQDQLIPGLGNAIAQDILFRARLHPRHPAGELSEDQRRGLYRAIVATVDEVIRAGGRSDEYDLFDHPGGYARIMDRNAAGRPCAECGTQVEKFSYLGGACYLCPRCQQ
jgi:formamidopyrimidine-DNA glycosylase